MRGFRSIVLLFSVLALLGGPLLGSSGLAYGTARRPVAHRTAAADCSSPAIAEKRLRQARLERNAARLETLGDRLWGIIETAGDRIQQQRAAALALAKGDKKKADVIVADHPLYQFLSALKQEVYVAWLRLSVQAAKLRALADEDPADPNFRAIAPPLVQAMPRVQPGGRITPRLAAALNALYDNMAQFRAFSEALLTAINRAQGAAQMHDAFWQRQQAAAVDRYSQRVAALTAAEAGLRAHLAAATTAAGLRFTVSPAQARQAQQDVAAHGLPAELVSGLAQAGVDRAAMAQERRSLLAADPQSLAGTFPAELADRGVDAATDAAAGTVRPFAAAAAASCAAPGPSGAPTPTPPPTELLVTNTLGGVSETRNQKTDAMTPRPDVIARLQSGQTYDGTVTVTGTLPAGYIIIVYYHGVVWQVLGPTGGAYTGITEAKGFGAATDVDAFACKQPSTSLQRGASFSGSCLAEGADVTIQWSP